MRERAASLLPVVSDAVLSRGGAFTVVERAVPGPVGAPQIVLLIAQPTEAVRPTPAFYYIHGGGMTTGQRRSIPPAVCDWLADFGAALVSVEHRLAPETPHPGPVEDCFAGLVWMAEHADELNIDPARIIIAGTSSGGGLAAATTLIARDRGGPTLLAQMLLCPMLDDRNDTMSAIQQAGRGFWDREANNLGWTALLGDARGGPDFSPYAAPARATDLSGLPPTYVDVGSAETFRDEDVAYATGIRQAGGSAELHVFAGGFHGYERMAPDAVISQHTRVITYPVDHHPRRCGRPALSERRRSLPPVTTPADGIAITLAAVLPTQEAAVAPAAVTLLAQLDTDHPMLAGLPARERLLAAAWLAATAAPAPGAPTLPTWPPGWTGCTDSRWTCWRPGGCTWTCGCASCSTPARRPRVPRGGCPR